MATDTFPTPALPGSGPKGMISARYVKAPPKELCGKINDNLTKNANKTEKSR